MVSFDPVTEKEEHPSAQKKSCSQDPFCKKQKDNPGKNHWDSNAMQEFIPAGLVLVMRHVVRQARHERLLSALIVAAQVWWEDSHRRNETLYRNGAVC